MNGSKINYKSLSPEARTYIDKQNSILPTKNLELSGGSNADNVSDHKYS